jgi:hypothetical protein
MSKAAIIKQLETVIGKLSSLNSKISGNQLQDAIRETARVRNRIQSGDLEIRKLN